MAINIYADVGDRIRKAVDDAIRDALDEALPPRNTPITRRQAALKYGVSERAIGNWMKKDWVKVLHKDSSKGPKAAIFIDEYDVANIVATNNVKQGSWTQPPNGHQSLYLAVYDSAGNVVPLQGTPISVTLASRKYGVSRQTIYSWVRKGQIALLSPIESQHTRRMLVEERDVAMIVHNKWADTNGMIK